MRMPSRTTEWSSAMITSIGRSTPGVPPPSSAHRIGSTEALDRDVSPKGRHRSAPLGRHDQHHLALQTNAREGSSCRLCRTRSHPRERRSPHDRPQHRDDLVEPDAAGFAARRLSCVSSADRIGPAARPGQRRPTESRARVRWLRLGHAHGRPAAMLHDQDRPPRASRRRRDPAELRVIDGPSCVCSPARTPAQRGGCSTS